MRFPFAITFISLWMGHKVLSRAQSVDAGTKDTSSVAEIIKAFASNDEAPVRSMNRANGATASNITIDAVIVVTRAETNETYFTKIMMGMPGNAPTDFWDKDRKSPIAGKGSEFEIMFCDRDYDKNSCGGSCNYVRGDVETGAMMLYVPGTRCIAFPCEMVGQLAHCYEKQSLFAQGVECEQIDDGRGATKGPNGLCWVDSRSWKRKRTDFLEVRAK